MANEQQVTIEQALAMAVERHRAGDIDAAESIYRQVLAVDPNRADALQLLGVVALQRGDALGAAELTGRAIAVWPDYAEAHHNRASALRALGRLEEAAHHYREVTRLRPAETGAWTMLGATLVDLGRVEESVEIWRKLIEIEPGRASNYSNLGASLERLGRLDEAAAACRRAVEMAPHYPDAHDNLGAVLTKQGRTTEAIEEHRTAIRLRPDFVAAFVNLANAAYQLGLLDEAVDAARRATELDPNGVDGFRNLGISLQEQGKLDEARSAYGRAMENIWRAGETRYATVKARLRQAEALMLPPVYESAEDVRRRREQLEENLSRLERDGLRVDVTHEPGPVLFDLAYQGFDDREIMRRFAGLFDAPHEEVVERARGERIRVGFASRFFREHTIGRLNAGVLRELSRERFHVTVLSVGEYDDALGRAIRESADAYVVVPPVMEAARRAVAEQKLDVLFYTDLGMDPVTWSLACSRLAAVQVATWGHPVTSGIPAVDCFLSSEVLDPAGNEGHYNERLERLPLLAVHYERPVLAAGAKGREAFGLPLDARLYGCLQMLWKFHPDYDELLAEILRRDERGRLVLVRGLNRYWDELLLARWRRVMPDVVERVIWLPRQGYADFLGLVACCDVMLDPIHFGGGNTTYEALAFEVPVITLPSKLMRGRLTLAMYEMMGMGECVAGSREDYVRLAVEIAREPSHVRALIRERSRVLYSNARAVRELEEFFVRVCRT